MKKIFAIAVFLFFTLSACKNNAVENTEERTPGGQRATREITGIVKKGETFFDIFKKYKLDMGELFRLREAAADVHRLRDLRPGRGYKITFDDSDRIDSFEYCIDEDAVLCISRNESAFSAERRTIEYDKKLSLIGGVIKDNLISSIGEGRGNLALALQLSDIYSWDIDFSTDLRKGDTFRIVVESLYLNGEFKKYGEILSSEFVNDGRTYPAYRFTVNGKADYFDQEGNSLRRAFLKAPLSFRRISSSFSRGRFHPVLKIYRPHHGLDFAAPTGTPVSSVGDGTVISAGYRGQYGRLVAIRHLNGYRTFYGHLSRIAKGVRKGSKVDQGQVIGYVGTSGLSTGPHLHYEVRINNRPVNPLSIKLPRGESVPKELMAEFRSNKGQMDNKIASIKPPVFAFEGKMRDNVRSDNL